MSLLAKRVVKLHQEFCAEHGMVRTRLACFLEQQEKRFKPVRDPELVKDAK